ncbi:MAG: type IV pilus twitching motility protein PilT [Alphaproteobacteria bacterium]|nr:type IV pilus twitching motility protein PilT [Alphaproteobacteria bacterium]
MEKILAYAKKQHCSDVHITTGSMPSMRIDGDITPIPNSPILTAEQVLSMIHSTMNDHQKKIYAEKMELDYSLQIGDTMRFRANAFRTINGPAIVFREIPTEIKSLDMLHAPEIVRGLAKAKKGMVLVVGPTGSGKSTTLAGLIDHINANHSHHILTIEDPVEFVHKCKKSLINQREVGNNTASFAAALKSALREDPDVILVGEMRDIETIHLALTAAETGHLVLGTLHTSSAAQTINRIIDVFPSEDKAVVRTMLSGSIKAVVSQRLLKKQGGGRVAAYEIMLANSSIRNLIREDKIPQINSIIELSKKVGMCLMRDSINDLLVKGFITSETAEEALSAND